MQQSNELELVPHPPPLAHYLHLRELAGLSPKTPAQATGALAGSWAFCHIPAVDGGTVAMGRVIGDGGWYFHIADMATLPKYQGRGLGRRVLDWLIADIRRRAPESPYINLIADPPGRRLYLQAGFRDVGPHGIGMQMTLAT